jgi:hypothetical protein
MSFLRRFVTVLVCFVFTAIAGDVCASIIVPDVVLEISADDLLSATASSGAKSASTSGSQDSVPSAPLPRPEDIWNLDLSACAGPSGSGSSSGMGGSSSPTFGGSDLVVACTSGFHVDDSLVGWLSQSRWLDIPMPPGVSLLRPPQAV